jgi:hypothetical protein
VRKKKRLVEQEKEDEEIEFMTEVLYIHKKMKKEKDQVSNALQGMYSLKLRPSLPQACP